MSGFSLCLMVFIQAPWVHILMSNGIHSCFQPLLGIINRVGMEQHFELVTVLSRCMFQANHNTNEHV